MPSGLLALDRGQFVALSILRREVSKVMPDNNKPMANPKGKLDRSKNTGKMKYEAPRVRRVRLDAASSVLSCNKTPTPPRCSRPCKS